jgi:serine O-acetyltransferase
VTVRSIETQTSQDELSPWACFKADRARYPRQAWLAERSLWAIAVYRFGQAILTLDPPAQRVLRPVHKVLILITQILTNIEISTQARIGPGLRIHHVGPIVVGHATLGRDCTLRVGNIIGTTHNAEWPTIGDRVSLGAAAQVLGGVTVGDDVTVGALSLVVGDVPSNTVVVGIPARALD